MTEITNLNKISATAALQVVIELIRAGDLKTGPSGEEADSIIATHKQLAKYFEETKAGFMGNTTPIR